MSATTTKEMTGRFNMLPNLMLPGFRGSAFRVPGSAFRGSFDHCERRAPDLRLGSVPDRVLQLVVVGRGLVERHVSNLLPSPLAVRHAERQRDGGQRLA